eukprot:TRINITY_DN74785_c0_g1_i1.p1 TRINITY_DN74785_c0_g1~~TRINITY_DN74785_c0_g1_i1.p1  ORF type:complete len:423 (+),score=60.05 TRINITY_DN74785_c0_g1_i1:86-1270(+)
MFASLSAMLSPRPEERGATETATQEGATRRVRAATEGVPASQPLTLRNFGAALPRPSAKVKGAPSAPQSARGTINGDGTKATPRIARYPSYGGGTAAVPAGAAGQLSARQRERGGVVRDGRDGYDVWLGVEQGEKKMQPRRKAADADAGSGGVPPAQNKHGSNAAFCRVGRANTLDNLRDGFDMFYGIGDGDAAGGRAPVSNASAADGDLQESLLSKQAWLTEVKRLEDQLQETMARGPASARIHAATAGTQEFVHRQVATGTKSPSFGVGDDSGNGEVQGDSGCPPAVLPVSSASEPEITRAEASAADPAIAVDASPVARPKPLPSIRVLPPREKAISGGDTPSNKAGGTQVSTQRVQEFTVATPTAPPPRTRAPTGEHAAEDGSSQGDCTFR